MNKIQNTQNGLLLIALLFIAFPAMANQVQKVQSQIKKLESVEQKSERLPLLLELGKLQCKAKSFDDAILTYSEAVEISKSHSNTDAHWESLLALGKIYYQQENYPQAIQYYESMIKADEGYSPQQMAQVHHQLCKVYRAEGNYELAYEYQIKALEIRKELNDEEGIARSYYQLGSLFYFQKNYSLALDYYQKTLDFGLAKNNLSLLYMSYGAIGSTYNSLGNLTASISYNHLALELAIKQKNDTAIAYALHNVGADYHALDSFTQALEYFSQALELKIKLEDRWGEAATLREIGNVLINQEKGEEGLLYLNKSLAIAQALNIRPRTLEAYDALAKGYEQLNMGKESIVYLRKYISLKDSLINESTLEKMGTIKEHFEVQLREKELVKKDYQIAQLHKKVLFGGILLLSTFLWLLYSRYQNAHQYSIQLKKKNLKIHQQNEELAKVNELQQKSNRLLRRTNEKIQLQNRKLENSNQELQRFAYIASHDLKEPLRTIGSYASLIKRRYQNQLDEEAREFLNFITTGVNRMYNLLGGVMSYSKLETTDSEDDFGWVNTQELVMEIKESLRQQFSDKNAQLTFGKLPTIQANRHHLLQIFQNLISNGLKYNDKSMPILKVDCELQDGSYLFSFHDNGIGLHMDYKYKIFEAFQRLHGKDQYEGTGIGLAICKKLITQNRGDIWVESQLGEGSIFYISLPAITEEPVVFMS